MGKIFNVTLLVILLAFFSYSAQNEVNASDEQGIVEAAMDYMAGAHEGNPTRIERSVHPELTKVSIRPLGKTGVFYLYKAGFTRLRELVRANVIPLPKEDRDKIKVTIFAIKEGLAAALAKGPMFYDYLQLAKIDNKWMLINVLWARISDNKRNKKTPQNFQSDEIAIKNTALDYIEGAYSGSVERMAKAIHPELTKVFPYRLPKTGTTLLNYSSAILLIEATRAKMMDLPQEKRNIKVKILDIYNDIAMVEVLSAQFYDYLQVARINNEWKIVNVLWKPVPKEGTGT
jgi:hypothetical protein